MAITTVLFDLDGTLLEPVEHLPDGMFETLEKLHSLGIVFAAASGRQYDNLRRLFAPAAKHKNKGSNGTTSTDRKIVNNAPKGSITPESTP